jgi:hypothetical protein
MAGNGTVDWRALCKVASQEQDPKKLVDLLRQINRALSEQRIRLGDSQHHA